MAGIKYGRLIETHGGSQRRSVKRVRVPDFWIAAWAHHLETQVVTRNPKHFEGLGVPVETW